MQRYASVIKLRPEHMGKYKELHANPWPEINAKIKKCNIRNYSIFLRDGYLYSYFEYTGNNYEGDMAEMAADTKTQLWWEECKPCQKPVESAKDGEWWANMEEVYHLD